jgi:CubicO group peptidase (beta-lactamase class C family)
MNATKITPVSSVRRSIRCGFIVTAIRASRHMNQRLWLFVLLLLGGLLVSEVQADRIDSYIEAQLKKQEIPGLALAVVREGKVVKAKGYGLADVELNVPVTEGSVFQWASVTKQFTATAIMLLAQDGKLQLTDPISRYYSKAPPAWSNVTVRHLLTHTSGIKGYTELPNFFGTLRKDYEPDELIGLVTDRPLDFTPGERWAYSNTGYYLLGLIIEKVSGQSYAEFLAGRIFRPCGMETARVNHQFELIPNRATGYDNRSNRLWRSEFVSPTQPYSAGALVGTVLDLAKWDAALYSDKLLPMSVLEEMWTPVKFNNGRSGSYGYGWQTGETRGHPWVGHGGGIHGFTSFILRLRDDKLTVIVLANSSANPQGIATSVAGQYISGLTLRTVKAQPDAEAKLSTRLKQCLVEMAERKDSDILTPEFRENFSRSRRRHAALQKDMKGLKSFTFILEEKPEARQRDDERTMVQRLRSYKLVTDDETRYYTFALTAEDRVARVEASDD